MSRLFPILAFAAALALFFLYVEPTWTGSIADARSAIAADNQALDSAAQYTARQNELASARNAIDPASLARLSSFLPDSVNNVRLILDLDALAARSGLVLSSIDVAGSASGGGGSAGGSGTALLAAGQGAVGSVDLSLSATGPYAALKTFLRGVESSERLLDVTSLSVQGSDTGIYVYEMTIRIYWLR